MYAVPSAMIRTGQHQYLYLIVSLIDYIEFSRARACILARRNRAKVSMGRPNEIHIPPNLISRDISTADAGSVWLTS